MQKTTPTKIEVIDGNVVTTKVQAPWELAVIQAGNLATAAFSFVVSRKLTGTPRRMLVIGSLLRVFMSGVAVGTIILKYTKAAQKESEIG